MDPIILENTIIGTIITFIGGIFLWLYKNTMGRITDLEDKNEKRKEEISALEIQMIKDTATKRDVQRLEDSNNKRFDKLEELIKNSKE